MRQAAERKCVRQPGGNASGSRRPEVRGQFRHTKILFREFTHDNLGTGDHFLLLIHFISFATFPLFVTYLRFGEEMRQAAARKRVIAAAGAQKSGA